jgi:multidrug efflux pump
MTNPLGLSIKFRTTIFSFAAIGLIWGAYQFKNSPRREDPEFTLRLCVVSAVWPGTNAVKMEELVTEPLERSIEELDSVKKTESTTTPGYSMIKVEMIDSVNNVEQVCDKIRSQLEGVKLPVGASVPYVDSNFADTTAMMLAVYQVPFSGNKKLNKPYSMRELEQVSEEIRDELKQTYSVAMINILSAQSEAIYIEPEPGSWSQIRASVDTLKNKLNEKNVLVAGGAIDTGKDLFNVSVKGDYNAVSEIKKTAVTNTNGLPVSLQQLGLEVKRDYIDPPSIITRISTPNVQNERCIVLNFTMRKEQNIVELGNNVRRMIKKWEKTILPPDIKVSIISDQPTVVTENIKVFTDNLIQAIVILILVAWLLIGKRIAFIMGVSIPVIVMISFGIVRFFNVQLEMMSIASLVISLGMLVDCTIEICDNVYRLQEEGMSRFSAAVEGSKQVVFPILIGTLTTVFAFLPMLGVSGNPGEYIRSIPIVVSVTLLVSWVVAITFTVALTWLVLKPGSDAVPPLSKLCRFIKGKRKESGNGTESFKLYKSFLTWCMKHRFSVLLSIFSLFVIAIALLASGFINTDFIPAAGGKTFLIDVWLPEGTSIKETSRVTKKIEKIVKDQSIIKKKGDSNVECLSNMVSFVGQSAPRFKLSIMTEFPKSNYAQIIVNSSSAKNAKILAGRISNKIKTEITEARTTVKRLGMGPGAKYPIMISLMGNDYTILKKYAHEIEEVFRNIPGTVDVHDSWGNLTSQIDIVPDEEKCAAAGISRLSVANTLNSFFSGAYLTTYREGDHLIPVYFRLPYSERNNLKKLKELYIEGTQGKIPLQSVAQIKTSFQPSRIERESQKRNMQILAQVLEGFLANPIINQAMPKLREIESRMPAGYSIDIGGTYEKAKDGSEKIGKAMIIALILIMLCLLVYFNSILKSLAVILTLPLAFTGAFFGLLIMNQPLGFFAQLGLLSLFGIVVNGAIVLFDFIGMLIEKKAGTQKITGNAKFGGLNKKEFVDCVIEGSVLRVRPIALTTLTTTGGLIPLAMSGGPLFEPMAVVVIFGLLYSTVLTLIVMPIVFSSLVEKFGMRIFRSQSVE